MTKTDAMKLLNVQSQTEASRLLGFTPQAFSKWPEELDVEKSDRVRGCAVRHGLPIPKGMRTA